MYKQYTKSEESQEDEYGPKRVFSIKHSEIPKGVTQCVTHEWRKLNENELECTKCPTAIIVKEEELESIL